MDNIIFLHKLQSKLLKTNKYNQNGIITFLNPYSYLKIRKSPDLLKNIDFVGIDGYLLSLLISVFVTKVDRLSFDFTSLADNVFLKTNESGDSIYIVGSDEKSIRTFVKKITHQYPSLNILGFRNGYFSNDELSKFIDELVILNPKIIIVGMGTPLQEKMLVDLKKAGWKGIGFTCGGFIHQTASSRNLTYYPSWVNKLNLRWLYRIFDEPKLIKRYTIDYSLFMFYFIIDLVKFKLFSNKAKE